MGKKTKLTPLNHEAITENSNNLDNSSDFARWLDKHPDEVLGRTGISSGYWIDKINGHVEADFLIDSQLACYLRYDELEPQERNAFIGDLLDILRREHFNDQHGFLDIAHKQSEVDKPLLDLVNKFAINRLQTITTDANSKKYILRFLNDFALKQGLDFKLLDASQATVEEIRGTIESLESDGKIYTRHNPPDYWPHQKSLIVVDGLDSAEDWSTLCDAFLYVAYTSERGHEYLKCDQLPEGSGFVVLSHTGYSSLWISIWGGNSGVTWPPPLSSKERIVYETAVALRDVRGLYRSAFTNRRGKTRQESEWFTEIAAAELLALDFPTALKTKFNDYVPYSINKPEIKYITRRRRSIPVKPVKQALCQNLCRDGSAARRLGPLGTALDCQVPVQYPQTKYTGVIDLVTLNLNTLWLLIIKDSENTDTLLTALLEIATFDDMLDYDSFLASYNEIEMPDEPVFQKGVLVCQGSLQQDELTEMKKGEQPNLSRLAKVLGVSFFLLQENDGQYVIEEVII